MKLKCGIRIVLLLTSVYAIACEDENEAGGSLSRRDSRFMESVSQANLGEVHLGQMAASKGTNIVIKSYARRMVRDYNKAQTDLKAIAAHFDNAEGLDGLDRETEEIRLLLVKLPDYRFDSAYIHNEILTHQRTLVLYDSIMRNAGQKSLRNYAHQYRPQLEKNLQSADSIFSILYMPGN